MSDAGASWLRLFQNGGGKQAPAALAAVGLPASIASVSHSIDQLCAAYDAVVEARTLVIVFDGHGRRPKAEKPKPGLAVRSDVIGPDDFRANLDCNLLVLGACFQGNDRYLKAWRNTFPNAVIIAAVDEVPDGINNGCALIANLVRAGLDGADVAALESVVREFEDRHPKIKDSGFRILQPHLRGQR